MAAYVPSKAAQLAEALCVDLRTSCAALERHGGDVDAAAASILGNGMDVDPEGTGRQAMRVPRTGPLDKMLEMGYARADAEESLRMANGDLDLALAHLLNDSGSAPMQTSCSGGAGQKRDATAASSAAEGDIDECAICCEPLQLTDAAMRCSGSAGSHHYAHAACLAKWVQQCRGANVEPTCPTCRGPLQMHRQHLRRFLEGGPSAGSSCRQRNCQAGVSPEDSEVLRSMLRQRGGRSGDDDSWSDIDFGQIAGAVVAAGALIAAGFAVKAVLDHFSRRRDESPR